MTNLRETRLSDPFPSVSHLQCLFSAHGLSSTTPHGTLSLVGPLLQGQTRVLKQETLAEWVNKLITKE